MKFFVLLVFLPALVSSSVISAISLDLPTSVYLNISEKIADEKTTFSEVWHTPAIWTVKTKAFQQWQFSSNKTCYDKGGNFPVCKEVGTQYCLQNPYESYLQDSKKAVITKNRCEGGNVLWDYNAKGTDYGGNYWYCVKANRKQLVSFGWTPPITSLYPTVVYKVFNWIPGSSKSSIFQLPQDCYNKPN